MDDIFFCKVKKARENVFDERLSIGLGEMVLSSEFGFEITAVAELGDDIAVSVTRKNFIAAEDINMI